MFAVYAARPNLDDPLASLVVGERPEPQTPPGWVRVKISHASLNRHDLFTLRGITAHEDPISFPMILGNDGAGTLDDGTPIVIYPVMGSDDWRDDETLDPGWHIFSERVSGTFADYVAVPKRNAIPLPEGLSALDASVLGTAWLTAYRTLFTKSSLKPGETLLVQGASGGMSTALIQLGRAAGFEVGDQPHRQGSRTGRKARGAPHLRFEREAATQGPGSCRQYRARVLGALDGVGRPRRDRRYHRGHDRPQRDAAAPAHAQRADHSVRIDHGYASGHEEPDQLHRRHGDQARDWPGPSHGMRRRILPGDVERRNTRQDRLHQMRQASCMRGRSSAVCDRGKKMEIEMTTSVPAPIFAYQSAINKADSKAFL